MSWKRPDVQSRMEELLRDLPAYNAGYILDLGTGSGVFASILMNTYPEATIIQSDIRSFTLQAANGYLAPVEALPHRHQCIDLVVAAQLLHYVKPAQQLETINQIGSLLHPDGLLVVIEYRTNRSYSWLPYPLPVDRIRQYARESDTVELDSIVRDSDQRRPKYAAYLRRQG